MGTSNGTAIALPRSRVSGNPEIKVVAEVVAPISPEALAELWWNMGDDQQAAFFNRLGALTLDGGLPMQLQYLTDHKDLSQSGRYVMKLIGEYAQEPPHE